MAYSEAQKRATIKYRKSHYSRVSLDLKKDKKDEYCKYAESKGMSLTAYIVSLIENDIKVNE